MDRAASVTLGSNQTLAAQITDVRFGPFAKINTRDGKQNFAASRANLCFALCIFLVGS